MSEETTNNETPETPAEAPATEVQSLLDGGETPAEEKPTETSLLDAPADGEKKPTEADEGEAETVEPVSFADFDLEGNEYVTEEGAAPFLELINNQELSNKDRAQKLLELFTGEVQARDKMVADYYEKNFTDMVADWTKEVKEDKQLGLTNFPATMKAVNEVINTYGSNEFREVMKQTGAGNNIHVIRFISNLSNALGEASPIDDPNTDVEPEGGYKPFGSRLYNNT